ncbi:putative xyloglucan endotransglucosylase/hydrolase protein 28 [Dorcoceras hygrometricum]|uniref:Xyloglucan endotransglucosylase/hydrolase n=1 Tax=Dorcoceras hygrometricum TaxID=472368 RepID=A0A2Z7D1X8_9LAMI|nr:putative xyloglucan endotransglucosylase/hydrolase protein 28 [Dorcoceras hygrometricum]
MIILFHLNHTQISSQSLVKFDKGFSPLYGELNISPYEGNKSVQISMDETTSSGFQSKLMYMHGYFESSIKLPENYSAGVVVTFYMCNNLKYPYSHDEIDFEFLGHIHGQEWLVQTNFYGNGSTSRGREERYVLGFDPSLDFHRYGILWTDERITYYVDDVPIRHVRRRVESMRGDFPSKEMGLYGTIWNGSDWATSGGQHKLDLRYGPYVAKYSGFVLNGCAFSPTQKPYGCRFPNELTSKERAQMQAFRRKYMTYSYCYDKRRYVVPLPECEVDFKELQHLRTFDSWTFGGS